MKYCVWNEKFTIRIEVRLDTAEGKTRKQAYIHNNRNVPRWNTQRKRLGKKKTEPQWPVGH